MTKKSDEIYLTANIPSGFNVNITLWGKTYHVQTEQGDAKNPLLSTFIYYKGEIVYSKKADYSDILNAKDYTNKLKDMMERQHKDAIEEFTKRHGENRKKIQYFDTVKKLLRRGNNKQALKILQDGLDEFPEDPFIMSYYGCLTAIVEKKFDEGIKICKKALERLDPFVSPEEKSLYTTFYLNLGRAYLAGSDKKSAIAAFTDGLGIDKKNHELLWELKKLGTRRKPIISFLPRGNPLNKYIGLLISKIKKK